MRSTVAFAWPTFCAQYEGICSWMYCDTKLKVTTGIGFLIDSVAAAQALPWWKADGKLASPAEVEVEWRRVKALTALAPRGGFAYASSAVLHIMRADIDRVLMEKTAQFWARLSETLPDIESFPADAQMAVLDEAWQNGPGFLDLRSGGNYVWAGTRAALLSQNFDLAADHVPGTGARAGRRRRLFHNAAEVVRLELDPERLWDADTPHLEDEVTPTDLQKISDLIDAKLAALPKAPTVEEVAAAVWAADVIEAPDADAKNPTWRANSYLRSVYLMARQARDLAKALSKPAA